MSAEHFFSSASWDAIELLALRAVGFVAGDAPMRSAFERATGLSPADLGRRPAEPGQLAAALDFLLADEARLTAFATRIDLPPEAAYEARRALVARTAAPSRAA